MATIESRSVSFHGGERQIVSGMLMLGPNEGTTAS